MVETYEHLQWLSLGIMCVTIHSIRARIMVGYGICTVSSPIIVTDPSHVQ